jgi:hypothetical protein
VLREKKGSFFYKSEVRSIMLRHKKLAEALRVIGDQYAEWGIEGVRVYECYGAGESERRWQPLRGMTRDTLLAVMRETRVQERQLNLKGRGYQEFIDALEKLGPDATVADVYDEVVPKVVAQHSRG